MQRSFNDTFSTDLTDEGLASGFEHTVHQKFMQMAPLSDRLRELQRCRTGMRSLTALVSMTLQMLQDQSDCESTDLARVCRWIRGRQWATVCRYIAPVVENGAENLTGRWYSGGQAHEVLLPLGAATTVTPVWNEPLGAAMTVTPMRTVSLGAATTVTPAELNLWARPRPLHQRGAGRVQWLLSLDRLVEADVPCSGQFPGEPPGS